MHPSFTKEDAVKVEAGYDPSTLKGKSVVVTGGASGLGEEMVRQFVKAGAFVTIGDLSSENGNKIVSELGEDKVAFAQCDVLKWSDQVSMFKKAISSAPNKQIDIVIANAGIGAEDTVAQDDAKDDEPIEPDLKTLKTNLIGVFYTAKLAFHYLNRNAEGSDRCLIMTASLAGYFDMPGLPQYNSAKWGVRGLMRGLRQTSPQYNIRVNIIAPWFVRTAILPPDTQDHLSSKSIDFAEKEDVGAAVLHLASDKSIHGRALTVVPRESSPRGYWDLQRDDFNKGDYFTEWQNLLNTASLQ